VIQNDNYFESSNFALKTRYNSYFYWYKTRNSSSVSIPIVHHSPSNTVTILVYNHNRIDAKSKSKFGMILHYIKDWTRSECNSILVFWKWRLINILIIITSCIVVCLSHRLRLENKLKIASNQFSPKEWLIVMVQILFDIHPKCCLWSRLHFYLLCISWSKTISRSMDVFICVQSSLIILLSFLLISVKYHNTLLRCAQFKIYFIR